MGPEFYIANQIKKLRNYQINNDNDDHDEIDNKYLNQLRPPSLKMKHESQEEGGGGSNESLYYRQMLLEHVQDSDLEGTLEVLRQAASIPDIYDTKDSNYSILHHCCYRGCLPIAKILVEGGANLCAVDKFHKTAIHLAVQNGYCELAEYLLQHVHPMDLPRQAKYTLIQSAACYGQAPIIKALVMRGINVNETNELGETPLHLATKDNNLDAMKMLIDMGADVTARIMENGNTPMHYACMYGYQEGALMLLNAGGDAHGLNSLRLGRTPLEFAKDSGYRSLFNNLLEAETNMREETEEKMEMFEEAEEAQHDKVLEKLEVLDKTVKELKMDVKNRRKEEKILLVDHEVRMQKNRESVVARKKSSMRLSQTGGGWSGGESGVTITR